MFKLFTFLFHTFPLILAWLYLLVAIFCVVVHIKQIKSKAKQKVHIEYDLVGYIPVDELIKAEQA